MARPLLVRSPRNRAWTGLTQANASSAEQSSSVAAELSNQSRRLSDLVASFQLEDHATGASCPLPGTASRALARA